MCISGVRFVGCVSAYCLWMEFFGVVYYLDVFDLVVGDVECEYCYGDVVFLSY